ncbi:class I SAM-dependent methyltransferase [Lactococcus piscium]|uniref:class I SAM-dependent DNA methyltransferase n=1 Tax=Pseudolactococcus carnosus TaxID=2749961 RepID=UPI001FBAB3C7|nr:class I SAM-dependent methyltransferase [Lactococcus carnosus]MCJ1996065.1 class I SAM-dependent methyltransferase [Lactococcus carnosus]
MDNYQEFARVYDTIMDDTLYDAWHQFSRDHLPSHTHDILELACGTGKLSVQFARDGYAVTGLDLSEEMLSIAYNRALDELDETVGIGFIEGDMRDLSNVGTYDAVTCYSDSICYMPDREAVQEVFDGVWNCLTAGGTFIFDVHSVNQIDQVFPGYSYHENEEDFAFMWDSFPGEKAHSITHELTFFVKDADGKFERRDEVHEERTYSIDNYLTMLDNAGFVDVTVFSDFQDITPSEKDDSARWFFIAKKG